MFGRTYTLTLKTGSETKTYTDLDIRFNIRKNCYFICDAKIDVLNPTREVMNQFTAHIGMYKESTNERQVTLEIGWASPKCSQVVFDGVVMSAMPTSYPPDIWFSMQCIGKAYGDTDILTSNKESVSISGGTLSSILGNAGKIITGVSGRKFEFQNKVSNSDLLTKSISTGFVMPSKVRDVMKQLQGLDKNLHVYADNGNIIVEDRRNKYEPKEPVISKDTGMIGLPRCNWPNYFVETMLRTDIDIFDTVTCESSFKIFSSRSGEGQKLAMENSGTFRVMGITYNGQFRSGKWAMALDLLQIDEATLDKSLEAKKKTTTSDPNIKGA